MVLSTPPLSRILWEYLRLLLDFMGDRKRDILFQIKYWLEDFIVIANADFYLSMLIVRAQKYEILHKNARDQRASLRSENSAKNLVEESFSFSRKYNSKWIPSSMTSSKTIVRLLMVASTTKHSWCSSVRCAFRPLRVSCLLDNRQRLKQRQTDNIIHINFNWRDTMSDRSSSDDASIKYRCVFTCAASQNDGAQSIGACGLAGGAISVLEICTTVFSESDRRDLKSARACKLRGGSYRATKTCSHGMNVLIRCAAV